MLNQKYSHLDNESIVKRAKFTTDHVQVLK